MENIYNYSQLEQLLQIAARLPTIGIKYIAQETGLNINTLYKWSCGGSHISARNANIILNWLNDCRPDALQAAKILYERGFQNE